MGRCRSELERSHLKNTLQKVGNDVVLRKFGMVAHQLTPHHLGTELGGLDVKG